MDVIAHSQHFSESNAVAEKIEYLYREFGDQLVSWNVSEYSSQTQFERYRLWWVLRNKKEQKNID